MRLNLLNFFTSFSNFIHDVFTYRSTSSTAGQVDPLPETGVARFRGEHRLGNPGRVDLELIEVQTGSDLGEHDSCASITSTTRPEPWAPVNLESSSRPSKPIVILVYPVRFLTGSNVQDDREHNLKRDRRSESAMFLHAGDLMTSPAVAAASKAPVRGVARLMLDCSVGAIPVLDDSALQLG
jgi:CBS domain-containing protein